jgi:hypothetical protein
MERSVDKVLEKIIRLVPEEEEKIKKVLNDYLESLWNKAPEVRRGPECWVPLQKLLTSYIPSFDKEWKQQILKEFNG